jgi:manganese/zinc/iron transport system substrate-binding protein
MKIFMKLMSGVLAAIAMAACKPAGNTKNGGSGMKVVATVGMIGDVAAEIGGERVSVQTLIGAGVDPHLYKPTVVDVKLLDSADIVLHNGLLLEGRMCDILRKIGKPGKPVHAVAVEALAGGGYVAGDSEGHDDPHVWMDVAAWSKVAEQIAAVLAKKDPANAAFYQERAAAYRARLDELDAYARKTLAGIPRQRRVLVTAHDAFGYMARAYGLEVRGVQGISTESEAGLKEINGLVDFLVERGVPAVFVESSVPTKAVVRIGGELFSDAMGRAGTYEGTYIGMIDHNVTTIARALGGEAPEKGLHGKLGSSHAK